MVLDSLPSQAYIKLYTPLTTHTAMDDEVQPAPPPTRDGPAPLSLAGRLSEVSRAVGSAMAPQKVLDLIFLWVHSGGAR